MALLIVLTSVGLLLLFLGLGKNKTYLAPIGILGLLIGMYFLISGVGQQSRFMTGMVNFDPYATAFSLVLAAITVLIFFLGIEYYEAMERNVAENYSLMLFSLMGAVLLTSFTSLVILFLGIEILSIPLYILSGSKKKSYRSNEASFKYFLLGSFASAFMLFGIALVYGATASFDLSVIKSYVNHVHVPLLPIMQTGILLIFIGMAFKIAAVPFHFWSPDVYEGSPTLITAFMATVVKTAGIAALWRLFDLAFMPLPSSLIVILWIMTFLTLALGNLTALWQSSFKRLLAYSSIANTGFLLLAVLSADPDTPRTLLFYSLTYSLATLVAFSTLFSVKKVSEGSEQSEIFKGLWKNHPFLSVAFTISLLSLAGIPPVAGFFAKYFVFFQAIKQDFIWITITAVLLTLIGIYYYFSVLRFVFSGKEVKTTIPYPVTSLIVAILCTVSLLALGLFPNLI
jgi:NADH-quinone oxidoreductase subunit N